MANRLEKMETVTCFILLCSKITGDGDCNHKIKRCLLLGRKGITNLCRVLKSKDITLPTKVHLVKAMVFSVVVWVWELDHKEGWVPKNWCFWIMVLEKTWESFGLQGDQTCQSERKSTLIINWNECYWNLMQRDEPLEKTLILGKIEGKRRRRWQRMRWLDSISNSVDMNLSKLPEIVEDRGTWHAAVHGIADSDMT